MYDLMDLTEELVSGMVKDITGGYVIKYHPDVQDPTKEYTINFEKPWKRIDMIGGPRGSVRSQVSFRRSTPYCGNRSIPQRSL
jgi:lysyl-tRNA synthetase class II